MRNTRVVSSWEQQGVSHTDCLALVPTHRASMWLNYFNEMHKFSAKVRQNTHAHTCLDAAAASSFTSTGSSRSPITPISPSACAWPSEEDLDLWLMRLLSSRAWVTASRTTMRITPNATTAVRNRRACQKRESQKRAGNQNERQEQNVQRGHEQAVQYSRIRYSAVQSQKRKHGTATHLRLPARGNPTQLRKKDERRTCASCVWVVLLQALCQCVHVLDGLWDDVDESQC